MSRNGRPFASFADLGEVITADLNIENKTVLDDEIVCVDGVADLSVIEKPFHLENRSSRHLRIPPTRHYSDSVLPIRKQSFQIEGLELASDSGREAVHTWPEAMVEVVPDPPNW